MDLVATLERLDIEALTVDEPQRYNGEPSWPPMDADEIEQAIAHLGADDKSTEAKERFRDLRRNPPRRATLATRLSPILNQ